MKVKIITVDTPEKEEAVIHAVTVTEDIQSAVDLLSNECRSIPVIHHNPDNHSDPLSSEKENLLCPTDKIYYIESVDKKTYVYTKSECYETKYRLYELENILNTNFFRSSKAMILNLRKIQSVKAEFNGRMNALLLNGEKVVIARSYVKELKERLGL